MKQMTVLEYLKETGLLDRVEKETFWTYIPLTIDGLLDFLEDNEFNYWSRPVEEEDLDPTFYSVENEVIVTDVCGNSRIFETEETETW